jgi:hypothetical protein
MNELYVETSNSAQGNSLVSVQTLAFQSAADKVPSQHFLFQFQDRKRMFQLFEICTPPEGYLHFHNII